MQNHIPEQKRGGRSLRWTGIRAVQVWERENSSLSLNTLNREAENRWGVHFTGTLCCYISLEALLQVAFKRATLLTAGTDVKIMLCHFLTTIYWNISFFQLVKMLKGILSVLLVLVTLSSAIGKPEKTTPKKEKRIPQTLSRGQLHENIPKYCFFSSFCKIMLV